MPFLSDKWAVESTIDPGFSRGGGSWYKLLQPLVYEGRDEVFRVPVGTLTDFATVPQIFTWLFARDASYTPAAILHDYLCERAMAGTFSRRDADGVFRRVLREMGVDPVTRWVLWAAVRAGGRMRGGASVSEWLKILLIGVLVVPVVVVPVVLCGVVWGLFWLIGHIAKGLQRK